MPTKKPRARGLTQYERYRAYIESPAWRYSEARLAELTLADWRCRICGRGEPIVRLEVHHRTYENLGAESVSDLCTLCEDCHRDNTAMLRARALADVTTPAPAAYGPTLPLLEKA